MVVRQKSNYNILFMKNFSFREKARIILAFSLLFVFTSSYSQVQTPKYNTSIGPRTNGYYEYLPQGYNNNDKYPLIVFFCGIGELGSGNEADLPKVLANGTPNQIRNGTFPTSFSVGGENFKFIVITPQFTQNPSAQEISGVLDNIVAKYRVDLNRIYLTGLSLGGGMVWRYSSFSKAYADRVAAIVPVCGAEYISGNGGDYIAQAKLAVWATHNNGDDVVSVENTNRNVYNVNEAPHTPDPTARKTIFNQTGHNAWSKTYDLTFKENNLNIYEWMLTYERQITGPLPITGLEFSALKQNSMAILNWSTVSENNNAGFEIQKSTNGTSFDSIGFVSASNLPSGANYSFTDNNSASTRVYYRLKQVDIDGTRFSYSQIKYVDFSVDGKTMLYPNPAKSIINISSPHEFSSATVATIYSYSGRMIKKVLYRNIINGIDISNIAKGNYIIKIEDGSAKFQLSFIKI